MDPGVADRLVLRALVDARSGLTLHGLHAAIAGDPESSTLRTFAADIGAALVRLLVSGEVTVEPQAGPVVYRAGTTRAPSSRSVTAAISSTAASKAARLA